MEEDKDIDEKIYTFKLDKMNAQEKKNFMVLIEKFAVELDDETDVSEDLTEDK